jgi:PhnB protein
MTGLTPYLSFDGRARDALEFYRGVFGGDVLLNTYEEFSRTDGPADAIAHGMLRGPVEIFAADAGRDEKPLQLEGVLFALLGTADGPTLETWFSSLSDGGTVVDPLQRRPWGAHDGQVADRFGVTWLVGYED